jgi:ion channel-forming bestrophin family protein
VWVDDKRGWLRTVLYGGASLPRIWGRVLVITGLSVVTTVLYQEIDALHISLTATPFTLIGLPLGIFLGFRNTSAYDRFWEGRKLWGALVNHTRSLTRQVLTLFAPQAPEEAAEVLAFQRKYVHTTVAFVHALRAFLRDQPVVPHRDNTLETDAFTRVAGEPNPPYGMLQQLGEMLREARDRNWIHPYHVPMIESSLGALTDIQGACERIKGTPIPFSYTVLLHRIVAAYCLLLPFGLVDTIHWATPVVVLFVSYAFFGLDAVGDEIEQPFGLDTNDLPLTTLSRNIEVTLRQRLGETNVPKPTRPRRGVLH